MISGILFVPVGMIAIGSGTGLIALPFEMFMLASRMPAVFPAHMVSSAAALLLLPVVLAVRHGPNIHRILGRLLGAFVLVGGLTALPVAIGSHSVPMARAGFFVQGLVWVGLFAVGIHAIRSGRRLRHARLMLAMAAVTTGAVWFRVLTGSAILLGLPFDTVYGLAAWIAWLAPLALVMCSPRLVQDFNR